MKTSLLTFLPFPRLPLELRLKVWRLALARTIEETWNNSKFQWELNATAPNALQAAHEVRAEFSNMYSKMILNLEKKAEGEKVMDNVRPFVFSKLDTLYVRREFHFNITVLSECLCSLQMDWGMEPYWWLGSQQQGPALLRQFPCLEIFTLVVRVSETRGQDMAVVEIAREYTSRVVEIEQRQYPEWRVPRIKFDCKKDQVDWNVNSMAESLLPENQSETALLYSWAFE